MNILQQITSLGMIFNCETILSKISQAIIVSKYIVVREDYEFYMSSYILDMVYARTHLWGQDGNGSHETLESMYTTRSLRNIGTLYTMLKYTKIS